MAESAVILRPISDVSVINGTNGKDWYTDVLDYDVYPEGSAALYLLVNEEVADDDATYFEAENTTSATDRIYTFGLSTFNIPIDATITGVTMRVRARHSKTSGSQRGYFSLIVDGVTYLCERNNSDSVSSLGDGGVTLGNSTSNTQYFNSSDALRSDGVDALNAYIRQNNKMPTLQYVLRSYGTATSQSSKNNAVQITQCYVEVLYEIASTDIGVHKKVNGAWLAATAAYRKQNGAWAEITADECKAILASSLCTK